MRLRMLAYFDNREPFYYLHEAAAMWEMPAGANRSREMLRLAR